MKTCWKTSAVLLALLGLTLFVYWPGLTGGFLFDDYPNLKDLGTYGGVTDWETLKSFALNGFSGPSGRPLSLLSFLLNDNTWPSLPGAFKLTNLEIHLVCGLLICWVILKLLREYGFTELRAQWMAVFASACWLLHPLMVSTTLYVVQRMAQLSTLFVFAGMLGYLHGRSLLPERKRAGYLWMTASLGLGTILGVLAKENGALLPLLLLVIEFCLPDSPSRPDRRWRFVFLALPALVLLGYLASLIDFSADPWPTRPFNQKERLWSEARILWEYLGQLFIPQIEGRGLYQDGYHISRGWLTPWTTLPAVLGLAALFGLALWLRRRWPLVSLALLFFFVGHLLESSVVGLELYFEHRNYLSAALLFIPVAWGLSLLATRMEKSLVFVIAALILALLTFFTWQRAKLWGDVDRLELYWANANPDSPRAHNNIAAYLVKTGRPKDAEAHFKMALSKIPDSALLNLGWLLLKIHTGQATEQDFLQVGLRLSRQTADAQAVMSLRAIVDKVVMSRSPRYIDASLKLVDALVAYPQFARYHEISRLIPYLKGRLYLANQNQTRACEQFERSISIYADTDAALLMVAETASYRFYPCAQRLLAQSEMVLNRQSERSLKRSRSVYREEIAHLHQVLQKDELEWESTQVSGKPLMSEKKTD